MMTMTDQEDALSELAGRVETAGFCFAPAAEMRALLQAQDSHALDDWALFADSWNDMPLDRYMADGGRYRRRRYATLSATDVPGSIRLEPHQPHYQSLLQPPEWRHCARVRAGSR